MVLVSAYAQCLIFYKSRLIILVKHCRYDTSIRYELILCTLEHKKCFTVNEDPFLITTNHNQYFCGSLRSIPPTLYP